MNRITIALAAALVGSLAAPAFARTSFIQDGAAMFTPGAVARENQRIGNFNAQTGKELLVVTVPQLPAGTSACAAAQQAATQQQVNGAVVLISKGDQTDCIAPDRAGVQAGWFSRSSLTTIRHAMESQFKAGNFDGGLAAVVGGILGIYHSHLNSLSGNGAPAYAPRAGYAGRTPARSGGIPWFVWALIIFVGFMILRSVMRAGSLQRGYTPGAYPMQPVAPQAPGQPAAPGTPALTGAPAAAQPGAPVPGQPGVPGQPMAQPHGGGFLSGMLGGLGGAFLGNMLFGGLMGGGMMGGGMGGGMMGGAAPDAGGWANDPGQVDMGAASGGDWGGGGFGDVGGGFGGGGGDSGGGW
ncbi:MAG: TPM domain-containing protein [Vulcanimicrobiaceae bacterium]